MWLVLGWTLIRLYLSLKHRTRNVARVADFLVGDDAHRHVFAGLHGLSGRRRRVVVERETRPLGREHRPRRRAGGTPVKIQAVGAQLLRHQLDVVVPARRFERGLVGVRVERLGRRVHAQRFRVAFRETVRGLEAPGFRADHHERVALQRVELADRRVERVLRVEDGLRRRREARQLRRERGDTGRGPADSSRRRADSGGVIRGPFMQVFVAVGNEVTFRHARNLCEVALSCPASAWVTREKHPNVDFMPELAVGR